jgi:hypothetical protein
MPQLPPTESRTPSATTTSTNPLVSIPDPPDQRLRGRKSEHIGRHRRNRVLRDPALPHSPQLRRGPRLVNRAVRLGRLKVSRVSTISPNSIDCFASRRLANDLAAAPFSPATMKWPATNSTTPACSLPRRPTQVFLCGDDHTTVKFAGGDPKVSVDMKPSPNLALPSALNKPTPTSLTERDSEMAAL